MRKNILCFIFLIFLVLVFFNKVFQGKVLLPADLCLRIQPWRSYSPFLFPDFRKVYNPLLDVILYFYPWRVLLERSLREGFIPLWNTYNFCGQPFLANMASACLYPLNWFLFFIPSHWFMTFSIIFHFVLTSIFTYLFLIYMGLSKRASFLGAVIWTFSGPMVVWAEYQTPVASMSWFPLSLLLWRLFIVKGNKIYALSTSIPLSLSVLGGHTQFAFYGWFAFVLFAIYQIVVEKEVKKGLFGLFGGIVLGLVFSLPQLLPSIELAFRSHRSLGSSIADLVSTSMPFRHLYTFLIPDFYGNPVDYDYRGAFNYIELCGYFGLLTFFLLPFSLRKKEGRFFLILALLPIVFSLNTPLLSILPHLPIFSFLSAPARCLYISAFSFGVLSAIGLDNIRLSSFKTPLAVFSILLFFILLGLSHECAVSGFPSPRALVHFFIIAFLTLLLIMSKKFAILPLLAIADLFAFGIRFNPSMSPSMLFPQTTSSNKLSSLPKDGRFLALPGERDPLDTLLPNCNIILDLKEAQGGDSLYPLRYLLFAQEVNGTKERSNALYLTNPFSTLIDIAGVKYIFSKRHLNNNRFRVLFYEAGFYVLENIKAFPRIYLSSETLDKAEDVDVLKALNFLSSKIEVIVEKGKKLHLGIPKYEVHLLEERSGLFKIKVTSDREAYLILTETFFPGWKAFVDGREEKVIPANFTFLGVLIPPGEHIVILTYRPFAFQLGFYLALLGLSSILAFLYIEGKRSILSKAKRR